MNIALMDHNAGIYLKPVSLEDAPALLELRVRNRYIHSRYEPKREEDFYTLDSQIQLVRQRLDDAAQDRAYMFGIFDIGGDQLIGHLTINNIVRGVGQFADVGYMIDHERQGQGRMTAAVGLAAGYAFEALGLHRLQAAILLHNDGSRRVLEKNGFQPEGVARKFIKIDGEWQDHRTYALLAEDWHCQHHKNPY